MLKINKAKVLWSMILLCISLIPISQFLSVRVVFLTFLFALVVDRHSQNVSIIFRQSWDIILYLSVLVIGLIYTQDLQTGIRVIETSFSLIALPIIFSKVRNFDEIKLKQLFFAFISGITVASTLSLIGALFEYLNSGDKNSFFSNQLTSLIDSHPTYLAYYLISAITFGLYSIYYQKGLGASFQTFLLLTLLFVMLMLTGSSTIFIVVLFVFSFFLLKYLLEEKTEQQTKVFILIIFFAIFMFAYNLFYYGADNINNDSWERLGLWNSAIEANPNFLLGVGTGDYNLVLNKYFLDHDLKEFAKNNFNSHNQFLQVYFSNGLIGVLFLLLLLGRPLYISVRYQNTLGILIFFPFLMYGMTEVFLGRYQGVVFFAFLHQIFISNHLYNSSSNLPMKQSSIL